MSGSSYTPGRAGDESFLHPPVGKRYVRTFMFSRRVDAPLASVHLIARVLFVLCLSSALLRSINTGTPDLAGAVVLGAMAMLLFVLSGMHFRIARVYLLLTMPTLFVLFATWSLLSPISSGKLLARVSIYNGTLGIGLALWELIWLGIVLGYFYWRRALLSGMLIATLVTVLVTLLLPLPGWTFAHVRFFHPLALVITDKALLLALTKVVGYAGMILATVALVVTSRDTELLGVMRQLRMPQPIIFFLSTVFRALTLALSDYETIYHAQVARAINARPRSFLRRLRDLGSIAVPMIAMMIRRSSEIGDALQARGYRLRQPLVDFYETSPWRLIDWVMLVLSLVLLYMAVGPHPALTALFQRGL